mgnify:CR=1 FL=1
MVSRTYTSRRANILDALVEVLKGIDGSGAMLQDVANNVHPFLKFWDEVDEFPAIHLNAGGESREYRTSSIKDRFLQVTIRCYVNEEDAQVALSELLEDVETCLEDNSRLQYQDRFNVERFGQQITIVSIDTDEGALEPLGVGEVVIEVRY